MKLYAQHGHADGEKTARGLESGFIDGVIFSPKDIAYHNLAKRIEEIKGKHPDADVFFDPQVYASFLANQPDSRMGSLLEDYSLSSGYFSAHRRNHLEIENNVLNQLTSAIRFQHSLDPTAIIAPNILIPNSCDSIEAVISKQFIRLAKQIALQQKINCPVYATLALSRDSLLNLNDFIEFLSDVTVLDTPPDGFYILIGASKADVRSEIFNEEIIAAWMLLNRTLSENGFTVVNGYSDLMTPFLGIAGASAGASGWWSNLRSFSLERFAPPSGGGSLPTVRYLSKKILGRLTYFELQQIRERFPYIMNDLPSDSFYPEDDEPRRVDEVLQTWDALKSLNQEISPNGILENINSAKIAIQDAQKVREIVKSYIRLENKSDGSHLDELLSGLCRFESLAELS